MQNTLRIKCFSTLTIFIILFSLLFVVGLGNIRFLQNGFSYFYALVEAAAIKDSGNCGDNAVWSLDNEGTLTISGYGTMDNYTEDTNAPWYQYRFDILHILLKDNITNIGDYAFSDCSDALDVIFTDSITSIGKYAFYNCYDIGELNLPDSVTEIGDCAFTECQSILKLHIPEKLKVIGSYFTSCGIINLSIPEGVEQIDSNAFSGCKNLQYIHLPKTLKEVKSQAFGNCPQLGKIEVDKNNPIFHSNGNCLIRTKEKELVLGCKNSLIPTDGSVTSLGEFSFDGCRQLLSINIPPTVTQIGDYAFSCCSMLSTIHIPDTLTKINSGTFYQCSALTEFDIPEGVTEIYPEAFCDCNKLAKLTIPKSVTSIGKYAFYLSNNLREIRYYGTQNEWDNINKTDCGLSKNITVFCNQQEFLSGECPNAKYGVVNKDTALTNKTINQTLVIKKGVVLTTYDTITVNGDIYVFGSLYNYGKLTVNGTVYALNYNNMFTAGNYNYGYFTNSGTIKITNMYILDSYIGEYSSLISSDTSHISVADKEITATCTQTGLTQGSHCTRCGVVIVEQITVPMKEHLWDSGVVIQEGDYDKNIRKQILYTCTVCKTATKTAYFDPTPKILLGDIDCNGQVEAADARLALRASVGLEAFNKTETEAADIDKNGKIEAADARLILRASVGLEHFDK